MSDHWKSTSKKIKNDHKESQARNATHRTQSGSECFLEETEYTPENACLALILKMRHLIRRFAVPWVLLILIGTIIFSFDFSPVDLIPNNATTEDTLICTWSSGNGNVNVTWYNNSVRYGNTIINASNPQTISAGVAKKGQVWNCTVTEWNDSSNIFSDFVLIRNANPSPPDIGNQTLEEDQLWSYLLTSTDSDGDDVEFFCLPASALDTCTAGGSVTWTPTISDIGLYNISFYAYDPYDGISVTKVLFNVTPINDVPQPSVSLQDISINEGYILQYNITITDEENNSGPFGFNVNSTYYPPSEKIEYNTTDDKNFIVRFIGNRTADYTDSGNHTINIRACDPVNTSLCFDGSFNLEVIGLNQLPNITAIESKDRNYTEGENFTLYINASDIDAADTLNITVASSCPLTNPWKIFMINESSNASAVINSTPLNDSHISCRNITIAAIDSRGGQVARNITLNVTNINDIPQLNQLSYNPENTNSNINISNLTAYESILFRYGINSTDDDILFGSDISDYLTFRSNSSLCAGCPHLTVNSTTGLVSFIPNESYLGNFSYYFNVTDSYGANSSIIMRLNVVPNLAPYFNQTPPNITAYEETGFNITFNATDPEGYFGSFSDNSSLFNINATGFLNFTPLCSDIGNYSAMIIINDTLGRENSSEINIEIIMVPDTPQISSIQNLTILEELPLYINVNSSASDEDLSCGQVDSLSYTSRFITGNTLFNISSAGIISFTPNDTSEGNYLINITIIDSYNLNSSVLWNLTILNRSDPPVINNVTPYGYPYFSGWTTPAALGGYFTTINASENMTIVYDHNSTDPEGDALVFNWTIDGTLTGSSKNLSRHWNFTDSGIHNVTLTVSDIVNGTMAHYVRFTWNTSVNNLNREPELNNSLANVSVNGTMIIGNYLSCGNYVLGVCNETRFYDPDADSMTYTHSAAEKVSISISGETVTFTGEELGTEVIVFTANDGSVSKSSNNVTVTVNELPDESSSSSSSSGGGGGSTRYVPYSVIQEIEKEKEIYFDIIVPEPVTIYKNDTIREVISLVNSGNKTLRGITLSALTNATGAEISFSKDFFPELKPGESEKTDLVVTAYKLLNNYEIIIFANITEPKYTDKAVIYINAIEKSRGNQSVTATKITFARDLLSSNPECLELNEFMKKAQGQMENGQYDEASKIVDSVIQGCKYLVSQAKLKDERPAGFRFFIGLDKVPMLKPAVAILSIVIAAGAYMTFRLKKENEKEDSA